MNSFRTTFIILTVAAVIAIVWSITLSLTADPLTCAKTGNLKRLSKLVSNDPSLANYNEDGFSVLMSASTNGHTEIVAYLLKLGANVNDRTKHGSALHLAAERGHIKIVELLLSNGADPNLKNDWGSVALHECGYRVSHRIADLLIKGGADPTITDIEGRTPLHRCKNVEVAKILIASGVDINQLDNHGYNALHYAARPRTIVNEPTILFLLQNGISTQARSNEGLTPRIMVIGNGQQELLSILNRWEKDNKEG